jgi:galactonate dehydratase
VRERIRVYSWIGGDRPDDTAEAARKAVAAGFTAVKLNATEEMQYIDAYEKVDAVLANVAAVREVLGPNRGIGIDFHGRVHKPMAKILVNELEPLKPMFIEEPVLSEYPEVLKELAGKVPIALGERLYSRWDFKRILHEGYIDIIQPDASHAGGISEVRKIAAMAEAYDVALALHCPLGPIALAACLQLDAVCYNAFIQEQSLGIHYNEENDLLDYVLDPSAFAYSDGFVTIPRKPGLGIELNEEYIHERALSGQPGATLSGGTKTEVSPNGSSAVPMRHIPRSSSRSRRRKQTNESDDTSGRLPGLPVRLRRHHCRLDAPSLQRVD